MGKNKLLSKCVQFFGNSKVLFLCVLLFQVIFFLTYTFDQKDEKVVVQTVQKAKDVDIYALNSTDPVQEVQNIPPLLPEEQNNIQVYKSVNPSIVNITTATLAYNWFAEPVPQLGASGSGAIIDTKGYILTNYHVVEDAYKVYITLSDGQEFSGKVVGKDQENDLAVISFDSGTTPLTAIPLGNSSNLLIGQKVLAIGNPFGLSGTLTTGTISALGRPIKNSTGLIIADMIQTDASINPGNSGGPLINSRGEMIGINTLIYSPSGASAGIGFAVPIDTAKRIVPDLIEYGEVRRGWINFKGVEINYNLTRYASLPVDSGLLVSMVEKNSNAEAAGLRGGDSQHAVRMRGSIVYLGGDIITHINNKKVTDLVSYYSALENTQRGDIADVTVVRNDGKIVDLKIKLASRPAH